ncbi:MAG: hypothetical protein JSS40_12460 [Proteobacteria bacterium]|nr:hypothetical protein [Pseudomonadota bacterium]
MKMKKSMRLTIVLIASLVCVACDETASKQSASRWTQFVQVDGQPEPVPIEWVSTPEGKLAHSIKIPNPLPKDSGYRKGMKSEEYFAHLCKTEAGEFIYKTVDNVEGFYFARPPLRPTDDDLQDRYKLEAPEIERTFQLRIATPQDRALTFVDGSPRFYSFVEEPSSTKGISNSYVRSSGYRQDISPMKVEDTNELKSRFGMVWRGVKRQNDRELLIAGSEWIVFDLQTKEVLALQRNFSITGFTRNVHEGIYWLSAPGCPNLLQGNLSKRFYEFLTKSLRPASGGKE